MFNKSISEEQYIDRKEFFNSMLNQEKIELGFSNYEWSLLNLEIAKGNKINIEGEQCSYFENMVNSLEESAYGFVKIFNCETSYTLELGEICSYITSAAEFFRTEKDNLNKWKEYIDKVYYISKYKREEHLYNYIPFGYPRTLYIIHSRILRKDFSDDYFPISNDENLFSKKDSQIVKLKFTSFYNYFYTALGNIEASINLGRTHLIEDKYKLSMYYGLYRYVNEPENRSELKKHILNNAQLYIDRLYKYHEVYSIFQGLAYVYPEVFKDFLERGHKIVKSNLELLDFSIVKVQEELSAKEKELLKSLQIKDLKTFNLKPKKLKKPKLFIENLIALSHNLTESIKDNENKLVTLEEVEGLEDERKEDILLYLKESFEDFNKSFWVNLQLYGMEKAEIYLEEWEESLKLYEKIVESLEEKPYIALGKGYYDLALIYGFRQDEEKSKGFFEKATLYLKGAVDEECFEPPVNDVDNSSINYIRNTYANFKVGNLKSFYNAYYDEAIIEEHKEDEQLEDVDLAEFDYIFVEEFTIKKFIKYTKLIIKVEKAKGQSVTMESILINLITDIWDNKVDSTDNKKEKIKKNLDKLYNSIMSHRDYTNYYPIYRELKKEID